MIVSAYGMELYCDHPLHPKWPEGPHAEFTADGKDCYDRVRAVARKKGWTLTTDNRAICPECKKK